jgi:surface protein
MANVITDGNIHNLVRNYINNRNRLPAWLQGISIGDWDVSRVTNMNNLFSRYANFDEPLTNWNVSRVTNMIDMFVGCTNFNQPLDNWNVSNVENMYGMFSGCTNFNEPLSNWDVSNVTNMMFMFLGCTNFNQPLNGWIVSNVENMYGMFYECTNFNQPLDGWNVSNVRTMEIMFTACTNFNQPLDGWNVSHVDNMNGMFENCTSFNQPLNGWNVSNVIFMTRMFSGCTSFNQPLNNWNVSNVTSTGYMFTQCSAFNQDLSQWNVARVTLMEDMFRDCVNFNINPRWQLNQNVNTNRMFNNTPLQGTVLQGAQRQQRQQPVQHQGLAWEVHNAFNDLDLPKFITVIRRENNGASNFKDNNNILEPVISYINSSNTALTQEQKTRYTTNFRKHRGIIENVNAYIEEHPEVKANTLEVIQFVLSQDPNYKDLYIETFENECMGGYSTGNRQSCTKGMFERIYMANKGTIEGLCFEELQGTSTVASARANACNPVYLELYSAFTPGSDIDINDIFQKWYNQFSYDAIPEETNPLRNLSVDERKLHFRNFVRQDEAISPRIWRDRNFQRKLEESIEANNIIFETLNLDAGLGRRRKRRHRRTFKHVFSSIDRKKQKQKKNQRKTIKKKGHTTMKHLKKSIRKTKARY